MEIGIICDKNFSSSLSSCHKPLVEQKVSPVRRLRSKLRIASELRQRLVPFCASLARPRGAPVACFVGRGSWNQVMIWGVMSKSSSFGTKTLSIAHTVLCDVVYAHKRAADANADCNHQQGPMVSTRSDETTILTTTGFSSEEVPLSLSLSLSLSSAPSPPAPSPSYI